MFGDVLSLLMTELFIEHLPDNAIFMVNSIVQSNPCKLNVDTDYVDVHVSVTIPSQGNSRAPLELMNALATVYSNQRNTIRCKGVCCFSVPIPESGMLYVNGNTYNGETLLLIPSLREHEYVEVKLMVSGTEVYKVHYTTTEGDFTPSLPRVEMVYLRLKNVPGDCIVLLNERRVMPYSSFPMVMDHKTRFTLLVRNADRIELEKDVTLDSKNSLDLDIGAAVAERRGASAPDESMNVFGDVFEVLRIPFAAFVVCTLFFVGLSSVTKSTLVGIIGVPVSLCATIYAFFYARSKA